MSAPLFLRGADAPPPTKAEAAYVRAYQEYGRARQSLGDAVRVETESWKAMNKALAESGPASAPADRALHAWEAAQITKVRAARALDAQSKALAQAIRAWAYEQAAAFARPEACHG